MRVPISASSFLSTLAAVFFTCTQLSAAKPYPHAREQSENWGLLNATELFLGKRGCDVPCGWDNRYCCNSGQACYTDSNNQAQCGYATAGVTAAGGSGSWIYYTSTWVETGYITKTSIYSSWAGGYGYATPTYVASVAATPTASAQCNYANNETPCGPICCASDQYCFKLGQCAAAAGGQTTTQLTGSATTTVPFQSPIATGANVTVTSSASTGGGGLSGGAIAGIVIGVLAGLILLVLLCVFCCFRAGWHGFLALFGLGGNRRRVREEYVEERIHHSSAGGSGGRRWYGDRPARVERPPSRKSGGMGGLLGAGAALAGLGAVLGIKRKMDRRRDEKSEYSSSSYFDSEYSSSSNASSDDRRTRNTRHSSRR